MSQVYSTARRFAQAEPRGICADLLAYWDRQRGARDLPARADLDPLHIPRLLPFITLYDLVGDDTPRFRYRLVGTAVVGASRLELTGKFADDMLNPDIRDEALGYYHEAAKNRRWLCHDAEYVDERGRTRGYQRIILPLSEPDKPVNMLMLGAFTERAPTARSTS